MNRICLIILALLLNYTGRAQGSNQLAGKWKSAEDAGKQVEFRQSNDNFWYGYAVGNSSDGRMNF